MLKASAVLAILALFSLPAEATPIQTGAAFSLSIKGETCAGCWPWQSTLPDVNIEALLSVVPVMGTFWDPSYGAYLQQNALMVTGISGTASIDCLGVAGCVGDGTYSLSFLQAPLGDGSYLWGANTPRYAVFSANGSGYSTRIINDNAYNLFQWSSPTTGFGSQVPINWSAVRVPEPSSLSLLSVGVIGVTLFKRRRRSRMSK